MAIDTTKVSRYMKAHKNIIISGPAGTGKTHILRDAANSLGLKMKYYSASTLDPFTDLVGIPVPNQTTKTVEYFRPTDIDQADVVFFDELNRAEEKVLNTVFEIIQFGTINGDELPNLKCVVAAINPNDGDYTVDDLDIALLDRFDVYLTSEPTINLPYFKNKYGGPIATAVNTFFDAYERGRLNASRNTKNKVTYISPRRMDKIVDTFTIIPQRSTIVETVPPGVDGGSINDLFRSLSNAVKSTATTTSTTTAKPTKATRTPKGASADMNKIRNMGASIKHAQNRKRVEKIFASGSLNAQERAQVLTELAHHLNSYVSPDTLVSTWMGFIQEMTPSDLVLLTNKWQTPKLNRLRTLVGKGNYKLTASI